MPNEISDENLWRRNILLYWGVKAQRRRGGQRKRQGSEENQK